MELEQIKEALKDRNLRIVSESTGVSRNTLSNIRNGKAKNVRKQTIISLSNYLSKSL